MGFQEVRQRNLARRQELQSRQSGVFVKWQNDKDSKLVKIVAPFEGFDRQIKQKDGTSRTRPHYRMLVLGEYNKTSGEGAGVSTVTPQQVLNMPTHEAKITTAPQSMSQGISDAIDEGHTIILITRKGAANSKDTTYEVFDVTRMKDSELKAVTPKINKSDIELLESQEQWKDVSPEEAEAFLNLSGGNSED